MLWGTSIALSWTWGLGLFLSVQMALHFGLGGLLAFVVPNAIGLMAFGLLTERISRRQPTARDFERHFFDTSHSLRYVILAYQFVAIALTFFAVFRYIFIPLGLGLPLGVLLALGGALMLGEQFPIRRIKWSHLVMFLLVLVSMVAAWLSFRHFHAAQPTGWALWPGEEPVIGFTFLGFLIPIVLGFLVGPWLDIQQWQRAIQIRREEGTIRGSYFFGGIFFFCILLFHGVLALLVLPVDPSQLLVPAADGLFHAKDAVTRFAFVPEFGAPLLFAIFYAAFLFLCIISTLDSGYVALKWYLRELTRKSEHIILSIIPETAMRSPVPVFLAAVGVGLLGLPLQWELEYFVAFYGSFSIGYAVVFLFRSTFSPQFTNFTQTTLFAIGAFSLGLFGVGYFDQQWYFMALGALFPAVHGAAVISGRAVVDDLQRAIPQAPEEPQEGAPPAEPQDPSALPPAGGSYSGRAAEMALHALENAITRIDPKLGGRLQEVIHRVEPSVAQTLTSVLASMQPDPSEDGNGQQYHKDAELEHAKGHFEGKWFTHTFQATYQDTNSVGNIYFGQYVMWVGKVREMFFRACMPDFDIDNTPFYILTRSIDHKFNMEAKEFEIITVRIRVHSFNRKFATLEHEILAHPKRMLGKGRQVLMFVNAKDYSLRDLPQELRTAFLPHI